MSVILVVVNFRFICLVLCLCVYDRVGSPHSKEGHLKAVDILLERGTDIEARDNELCMCLCVCVHLCVHVCYCICLCSTFTIPIHTL